MSETAAETTRRVLREQDLPEGLLPPGMSTADVTPDGRFRVAYPRRIERNIGGYRVRYGTVITGLLRKGEVDELKGVDAHKLVWVRVRHIRASTAGLAFSVGPIVVDLPPTAFD